LPEHEISYGKAGVHVYRIGPGDTLFAVAVDVEVFGDNFLPAYTEGDNANVVATDSMKNFVLRHGAAYEGATVEGFLDSLGRGLLERYDQMESLRVTGRELRLDHVRGVVFELAGGDHGVAQLDLARAGGSVRIAGHRCGRVGLRLWKLRGSAFTRFVRDEYTTLPERGDRPLFILLDVHWRYADPADALEPACHVASLEVKRELVEVFDRFVSESIQHLVREQAEHLLERFPQLAEVSFSAQNHTRDPVAGSDAGDGVRAFSDPFPAYGTIRLTLRR
jgi:urate oxidase